MMPELLDVCSGFLLAQANGNGQPGGEAALPPLVVFLIQFGPILLIAFFLFFWLPMRNQRKHMEMVNALKKNDRVVTQSGIFGTVVSIDPEQDRIVLRIDDDKGVRITCRKSSVAGLAEAPAEKAETKTVS